MPIPDPFDEFLRSLDDAPTAETPVDGNIEDVIPSVEDILNGEGEVPVRFVGGPLHGQETNLPTELDSLYPREHLLVVLQTAMGTATRRYLRRSNTEDDGALFLYVFDFDSDWEPVPEGQDPTLP